MDLEAFLHGLLTSVWEHDVSVRAAIDRIAARLTDELDSKEEEHDRIDFDL